MTETEVRALIESMTAWDTAPALSSVEVTRLVRRSRRADRFGIQLDLHPEWAASTAYAVGDKVYPTVRNGHVYEVTVAGTSDTSEPTWPLADDATVVDGATFAEAGADPWLGTYDVNAAAAEGWRWKAAKVATSFTFSSDGQSFNRSDMVDACLAMAKTYGGRAAGSIPYNLGLEEWADDVIGNLR